MQGQRPGNPKLLKKTTNLPTNQPYKTHCQNKVQGTHLDHINGLDDAGGTHAGQTTIEEGLHGGPESGFGLVCVHGGAESAFLSIHGGHGRSQKQSVRGLQNVSLSTSTLRSAVNCFALGGVAKEQFGDDRILATIDNTVIYEQPRKHPHKQARSVQIFFQSVPCKLPIEGVAKLCAHRLKIGDAHPNPTHHHSIEPPGS
jgi:hypothetical protein